ncbi:hypothetical protein TNCV_2845761 [Trichonephila clavipes]|nr:hypothetical protein TNCV_2845761 [Trichonephila clavipes]
MLLPQEPANECGFERLLGDPFTFLLTEIFCLCTAVLASGFRFARCSFERKGESHYKTAQGLLATDVILNHAQVKKTTPGAVGSLEVRTSDSRPEGLGSMPDATK